MRKRIHQAERILGEAPGPQTIDPGRLTTEEIRALLDAKGSGESIPTEAYGLLRC